MNYQMVYQNNLSVMLLLTKCKEAIRVQDYDSGVRRFREFLFYFQKTLEELIKNQSTLLQEGIQIESTCMTGMLSELMEAQKENDYILLADYLELKVQPFLVMLQNTFSGKLPEHSRKNWFEDNLTALQKKQERLAVLLQTEYQKHGFAELDLMKPFTINSVTYSVEETQKGYLTIKVKRNGHNRYYHSNQDPREEGMHFASHYYNEEAFSYEVLGAGLLYHVWGLADKVSYALQIKVYEPDMVILIINMMHYHLAHAFENFLTLHYDPNLTKLIGAIEENPHGFVIHAPSIENIAMDTMKERMRSFFITDSSFRNQQTLLDCNFKINSRTLETREDVSLRVEHEIWKNFYGRDVYIIAAGPSLDKNLELLRKRTENTVVISTGTTFHKMLAAGIRPDYVMVTDPNDRVIFQLRENEEETIPMILLSTANRQFIQKYHGKKYLIFQNGYRPAEEYAIKNNLTLYETGGSVTTTALDFSIRAKAGRIIFLGLDLAFTNNLAHASDTSNMVATDEDELLEVKEYYGGKVFSDAKFIMYRKWIEKRIQSMDAKQIQIINATEGGSYILGMKHIPLDQVIGKR